MCKRYNEGMESFVPIIVSIIGAVATIAGAFIAVNKGNREKEIKDAQREQRQSDRLDSIEERIANLSKKVDIHNGYAEKFGQVATNMALMAKDIEYLKNK